MVRVEVIEKFTLKDYAQLQNVERRNGGTAGSLYVGDRFECSEDMAKYLMGDNALNKAVVKLLEVDKSKEKEEEVEEEVVEVVEENVEEVTPLKENVEIKKSKKKSSKK